MTESEKLEALRISAKSKDDDSILLSYLQKAGRRIINRMYPYVKNRAGIKVPEEYESLQIEIATVLMNKRGIEGETEHTENGTRRAYGVSDIPTALLAEITPVCGLPE